MPATATAHANATGQGAAYWASLIGSRWRCSCAYAGAANDVYNNSA